MWRPFYLLMRTGGGRQKEKLKAITKNKALRESVMTDEKGFAKDRSARPQNTRSRFWSHDHFLVSRFEGIKDFDATTISC